MSADDSATTRAKGASAFIARLSAEPWRYSFYAVLRKLENLNQTQPRFGEGAKPVDESIRLGQPPALDFAAAELAGVVLEPDATVHRLDVRFFGLFGPHGPLPLHLTEFARERSMAHDPNFAAFANLFHHRLLLLFYRAWAQAQPTVQLDRGESDRFALYTGSLIGFGGGKATPNPVVPDHLQLFFAGRFAEQVRSAEGLQAILASHFRAPVQVQQFVGQWLELPASERSRLQRRPDTGQQLGVGLVLGRRVWDAQHKFRVRIGPLTLGRFDEFLSDGKHLEALAAVVRDYVNHMLEWDLLLSLNADEVPAVSLGGGARLGRTTWLQSARPRRQAASVCVVPEQLLGSQRLRQAAQRAALAAGRSATAPSTHS